MNQPAPGWKELPPGAFIDEPGNSAQLRTGAWRSETPVFRLDQCTHCMICWVFCPDDSIVVEDCRVKGIDLFHCKGCGICAAECPRGAITMEAATPGAT